MTRIVIPVVLAAALASVPADAQPQKPPVFDSHTISGLGARNIGSARMSGRIAAIDAVDENGRVTVYVGSASGGVWKSTNGGTTYKPVFDEQPAQSIGAIAIDPSNHQTVWVGTGEPWTRNSVSVGEGVFKSTDGGQTWTHVGLDHTERIAKIIVDPSNSDTVYVCAPGPLWSDGGERGVYKTTDGGRTWQQILKGANASTGCGMMSLNPQSPGTLFAGLWDFRRTGWNFRSGGNGPEAASGSGLFTTTDRGATWHELDARSATGLPAKPWGRIAVTVAPSKPSVVYAFIESVRSALFRSDDGGKTWQELDRSQNMVWRPFYFANLIVDPKNENRLFKPNLTLIMSTDGGRSFSPIANGAHGDFHDVWINPANTNHLIAGDDGGVWYSYDGGARWWKADNLPVSQFYHVSVDMADPYNVYGGLQDNSVWWGPSSFPGGVPNSQWDVIPAGDGFWMFADPADANYIYAESQGGELFRFNKQTRELRSIKPRPNAGEKLRFNWNTPIHMSPNEKGTIYIGAQFLFRSRDHGQSWDRISPDLTTNDPEKQKQEESGGVTVDNSAAEMHTTIYSISESPRNGSIIWVGTDDGNLQITRDAGKTWTNVAGNVPGLPKASWVSWVEAGRFEEGVAYAAFDRHTFGDMAPYVYRTSDYGRTWTRIIDPDKGVRGYAHVIREDVENPALLFAGTEFGLWISVDGGARWAQYKGGSFPDVAVRDLVVHPREADLVVATHGRGIWIVDDITPLRTLSTDVLTQEAVLISGRPSPQRISGSAGWPEGDATFFGPSRENDAVITYYQRSRHLFGDLKLEVFDAQGKKLEEFAGSARRGLNRVTWSMRVAPPRVPPAATIAGAATVGPRVVPGEYTVKLTKGKQVYTTKLTVVLDPRADYTVEDRQKNFDAAMRVHALFGEMTDLVERIAGFRGELRGRIAKLSENDPARKTLSPFDEQADALRKKIVATREGGAITGEERIRERVSDLYGALVFYEGRPADYQLAAIEALTKELTDVRTEFDAFISKSLPQINRIAAEKKLPPITMTSGK
ncbi:MAG TPA: hypothetical protein VFK20_00570 [Vicinamibacterales bacterium]|nr:hypothetical protein [Vicinamibacterales bacterium]